MCFSSRNLKTGFTLLELSIVLVVIGLVIGTALVGRDMINAATIRSLIAEKDKLTAATNTFYTKYNCIAGDCPNATSFFSGVSNGSGNGSIQSTTEMLNASYQLSLASLTELPLGTPLDISVGGCNSNPCMVPAGNMHGSTKRTDLGWLYFSMPSNYFNKNAWNYLFCGAPTTKNALFLNGPGAWWTAPNSGTAVITGEDAKDIDTKIDDGKPFTGNVLAGNNFGGVTTFAGMTSGCLNTDYSSGVYYPSNKGNGIMFRNEVK